MRFGPFFVNKLVGKNAVKVELPSHFTIHDIVHVFHTTPYHEQPSNISAHVKKRLDPVPAVEARNISLSQSWITGREERGINSLL